MQKRLHLAEVAYNAAVKAYQEAENECRSSFYDHNQASYWKGQRDAIRACLEPRQAADYGDFTEYEVSRLIAEYCMSVTLGTTGWGVSFARWVENRGIAIHDKMFRLIRLPCDQLLL